LQSVEM